MTVIAVLAAPPREGVVLSDLVETSPLTETEATALYEAAFRDVCRAVHRSGGDLLVNYHTEDTRPGVGDDAEAELRAIVADTLGGTEDVRFEPQVGSSRSARVGNTVTHLLRDEGVRSAAVVPATAAFLTRSAVDSAAMKLRSTPVVLGPATDGRLYYAGFTDLVDFEGSFEPPAVESATERARDADLPVDFLGVQPLVERGSDLATALPLLHARRRAERIVPRHTAEVLDGLDLHVERGSETRVVRS